jgi:hypothetical protein
MNAAGFHILAMLLLSGTALVVRLVALALTSDDGVGWGSVFLYAAAAHNQVSSIEEQTGKEEVKRSHSDFACALTIFFLH